MNKHKSWYRIGIGFTGIIFLLVGCASTPTPAPEVKQEASSSSPPSQPEKKAKTIILRIPRVTKESAQFPDGTEDEYTLYTYSPDGKLLLKEELYDAASKDLLESREYHYQGDLVIEKRILDGQKKLKSRRVYRYTSGLLTEESQFDKENVLQARLTYQYDAQNRKIEWKTLDASGSVVGMSKYYYNGEKAPIRTELYGAGGNLELVISTTYTEGKKAREVFATPDGKVEKEVVYRYDEKGRLLGQTEYSSTKAKLGSVAYEYPADASVPSREIRLDGRDKPRKVVVFEYAYREESKVIYE